jgi:hypothetical protein
MLKPKAHDAKSVTAEQEEVVPCADRRSCRPTPLLAGGNGMEHTPQSQNIIGHS